MIPNPGINRRKFIYGDNNLHTAILLEPCRTLVIAVSDATNLYLQLHKEGKNVV
jgi:hypothetical protein